MQQGEIWFADLNPTKGSEQIGKRPVVIISGDYTQQHTPYSYNCSYHIKDKIVSDMRFVVSEQNERIKKDFEAVPFQIRAIAKKRLANRIGHITEEELREILKGLFLVLTH